MTEKWKEEFGKTYLLLVLKLPKHKSDKLDCQGSGKNPSQITDDKTTAICSGCNQPFPIKKGLLGGPYIG
jgi:hypothetical protein